MSRCRASCSYDAGFNTALVHAVKAQIQEMLPGVPVATPLAAGATDRPPYSQMGIQAYGLDPCITENMEAEREVHGIDERLSIASIAFGLKLVTGMIRRMQ